MARPIVDERKQKRQEEGGSERGIESQINAAGRHKDHSIKHLLTLFASSIRASILLTSKRDYQPPGGITLERLIGSIEGILY